MRVPVDDWKQIMSENNLELSLGRLQNLQISRSAEIKSRKNVTSSP